MAIKDSRGNDLEGQVYANGKRLGSSLKTHKLPVCSQNIEVDLGKYGRKTVSVTLQAKQTVRTELVADTGVCHKLCTHRLFCL